MENFGRQLKPMAPRLPSSAKQITVIETVTTIGTGIRNDDPCRIVKQYWSLQGELLATYDELADSRTYAAPF